MKGTRLTVISAVVACLIFPEKLVAQSVIDAGKYAQSSTFATARSIGFGGALGSVGGDFSSLSVNPAGIGIYRTSEFMITPGLRFNGTKSTYNASESADNGTRFGFNNIGLVFTDGASEKNYDRADWKSASFGIGLNRTADFSRAYNYNGKNYTSSASQYFEGDAYLYPNSTTDDPGTPAYLGYQSYLLSGNNLTYVPYTSGINQEKTVRERGGITEMAISGGGNYQDKLMIGATLGINFLNHRVNTSMYEETFSKNQVDSFDNFTYNESYKTNGTGVNLKLGAIYKFNEYFRAGIAFHTPTIYTLTEISNNNIATTSLKYGTNEVVSPENQFEYSITTPFKAVASATGMLGKYGFVSVDYEIVGYGGIRYSLDDAIVQDNLNKRLKNLYQSNSNIRVGTELRFDQLRVRGGYGFYGSPYKNKLYQGDRNDISFGLGYRFGQTFVDFAVINSAFNTTEQPYVLDGSLGYNQPNTATVKNNFTTGVVTIGWKL